MGNRLGASRILEAFGVEERARRACSINAISSKSPLPGWRAFTFDLPIAFYHVSAPGGKVGELRAFASGIRGENFVLLVDLDAQVLLILRRSKKGDNAPAVVLLRGEEDYERVITAIRKFNFISDELTAH